MALRKQSIIYNDVSSKSKTNSTARGTVHLSSINMMLSRTLTPLYLRGQPLASDRCAHYKPKADQIDVPSTKTTLTTRPISLVSK